MNTIHSARIQSLAEKREVQSCQSLSHIQLFPINGSTPGFPACHQLLELAQTHLHPVGDAIQPSHPLSSPSPPAFNLSEDFKCLFKAQTFEVNV